MVDLNLLLTQTLLPVLTTILSGVAIGVLTFGYNRFTQWTGIKIEANDRDALHRAIQTGIGLAVSEAGKGIGPLPAYKTDNPLVAIALRYVVKSVPDAIARFDIREERIAEMIVAKLPEFFSRMENKAAATPVETAIPGQMRFP